MSHFAFQTALYVHNRVSLLKQNLDWVSISDAMLRSVSACHNRYQRHLVHRDTWRQGMYQILLDWLITNDSPGTWSPDKEARINQVMQDLHELGKMPTNTSKFWKEVSGQLGRTWTPDQCRSKW